MSNHTGANCRMTRIIANAGSGKTYELSTRYIAIIAAMLRRESSGAASGSSLSPSISCWFAHAMWRNSLSVVNMCRSNL